MQTFRYFQVDEREDVIIATIVEPHLQGEMMAELVRRELFEITDQGSPQAVIVDFRNVNIISTSIVSSLLTIRQRLSGAGVHLILAEMSETLRRIFKTLHLDRTFTIEATIDDALKKPHGPITYEDVVGRPTPFDLDDAD